MRIIRGSKKYINTQNKVILKVRVYNVFAISKRRVELRIKCFLFLDLEYFRKFRQVSSFYWNPDNNIVADFSICRLKTRYASKYYSITFCRIRRIRRIRCCLAHEITTTLYVIGQARFFMTLGAAGHGYT